MKYYQGTTDINNVRKLIHRIIIKGPVVHKNLFSLQFTAEILILVTFLFVIVTHVLGDCL